MSALVRRLEAPALYGAAAVILLVACAVPLVALVLDLAAADALAQLQSTLGSGRSWILLTGTVGFGLATTVATLLLGLPLGVLLGKCDVIGRRWAFGLHLFPMFLPPFLLALGWFQVFGTRGFLGSSWTSGQLFGTAGALATLTFCFTPVVTALTALGLSGIDPSFEDAARVVGSSWRVVTRILLPLAWPSVALAALVVFSLTVSEIGVFMFLGVRTYPAAVFTRLAGMDYAPGEAVALVLPLLAIGLLLAGVDRRLIGARSYAALGVRWQERQLFQLGRARWGVSALTWLVVLVPLVPLGALAVRAGPRGLLQALGWIRSSLATSLAAGLLAAMLIGIVGVLLGHALARAERFARPLDTLALMTFMTPSSVLGVGLIAAWNRPVAKVAYTSLAIIVLGLVARYAVVGVRALAAVLAQSSPHHEQAAAVFGSGFARRMLRIVLPMHARGIIAICLVVLVFCLRDLDAVVVYYPPGLEPLSVRIFTLEANGSEEIVAALSVIHTLVTALLLFGAGILTRSLRRLT